MPAPTPAEIALVAGSSFVFGSAKYEQRDDGSPEWPGKRPGPGWHAHDFPHRTSWMLEGGRVRRVTLYRRRWLLYGTTTTQLDRAPDEIPLVRACTLLVAMALFGLLDGDAGLENHVPVHAGLADIPSRRQLARWLRRATDRAMDTQQRLRLAVIERSEPRPVEMLFPVGLAPPPGLVRRRWSRPDEVENLWRGLTLGLRFAIAEKIPLNALLAEARGRWPSEPLLL